MQSAPPLHQQPIPHCYRLWAVVTAVPPVLRTALGAPEVESVAGAEPMGGVLPEQPTDLAHFEEGLLASPPSLPGLERQPSLEAVHP